MKVNVLALGLACLCGCGSSSNVDQPSYMEANNTLGDLLYRNTDPNAEKWPSKISGLGLTFNELELLFEKEKPNVDKDWKKAALETYQVARVITLAKLLLDKSGNLDAVKEALASLGSEDAKGSKPLESFIKGIEYLRDTIIPSNYEGEFDSVLQQMKIPTGYAFVDSAQAFESFNPVYSNYAAIISTTAMLKAYGQDDSVFTIDLPYRNTSDILQKFSKYQELQTSLKKGNMELKPKVDPLISAYVFYNSGQYKAGNHQLAAYITEAGTTLSLAELFLERVESSEMDENDDNMGKAIEIAQKMLRVDKELYFEGIENFEKPKEFFEKAKENLIEAEETTKGGPGDLLEHDAKFYINLYYSCMGNNKEIGHCAILLCQAAFYDSPLKEAVSGHCRNFLANHKANEILVPQYMNLDSHVKSDLIAATDLMRFIFASEAFALKQVLSSIQKTL